MVDEREPWLARRFEVLEDVDVPALWDQIVGRVDTEPNEDLLRAHRRRWIPLAAAAAVVAIVAGGLVLWARGEPTEVDLPPGPAGGDNTVQIVEGDDEGTVTPTATAGIVTFDISNPTDANRGVQISRLLPGATIDDVRAAALEYARTGAVDTSQIMEDPALGVVNGPRQRFVTTMPLAAGDYAVFLTTADATLVDAPGADGHEVRQLTVTTGEAGTMPPATLTFDRMAEDYLIGPTTASPGPATIRVDNTVGSAFQLSLIELRPDVTEHDYTVWEGSSPAGVRPDWSTAPVDRLVAFYAGTAEQTVTVDLQGGDLRVDARPLLDEGGAFSFVWVTVE